MLIVSTTLLLILVGGIVYVELRWQLQTDGQLSLRSEVAEVRTDVGPVLNAKTTRVHRLSFSDDRGQNVFFLLTRSGLTRAESTQIPVPVTVLRTQLPHPGAYAVFQYQGKVYRIYREDWTSHGRAVTLFVYKLILQEQETLARVRNLLLAVGGAGALLSVGSNLWLARSALRPARQTWAAHQNMLVELSHELQTPLATIRAITAMKVEDAQARENLVREIGHASELVQDILYLSRLRSTISLQLDEPVAVSDITEEVAERFVVLAAGRELTLHGRAEPGLYVNTTSERWARLVSTLLKNVVDHAAHGSEATWSLRSQADLVRLTLTNRVDPRYVSRTPARGVQGFGMEIARRLAADMAGVVDWQTTDDGAVTTVIVPRLH